MIKKGYRVPFMITACLLLALAFGACTTPTHIITVKDGETFDPQTLEINEGDQVIWVGDGFLFANTDSIARIGLPGVGEPKEQVCGAVPGGSKVLVSQIPAENFYGPKRKGISGIHVLAPQGYGLIETSTLDLNKTTCNDVLDPADDPNVDYITGRTHDDAATGLRHFLCSKTAFNANDTQGGISQVLQSVWDNPDIDGVVLRVRWTDFQYHDGTSVVTVWTDIDREFREAIKRGKTISINFHAGEDTPDFIFNDYLTAAGVTPAESNVVPVGIPGVHPVLRDFHSDPITPASCGQEFKLGSPTDPNYVAKIKGLYDLLAAHVKDDARFFQALGYVKVSGLNLYTGEARLPKRCLDPDEGGGAPADECVCNTEIWATTTHPYTQAGLYTFYNDVENNIFAQFNGEKSLNYMLIQDGFPRVDGPGNYFRDPGYDLNNDGTPDGSVGSFPGPSQQTEDVLAYGRGGRFAAPGDPTLFPDDPATGKLFVAQHSGLGLLPRDQGIAEDCAQTKSHSLLTDPTTGKVYHDVYTAGVPAPLGGAGGCPNNWAVTEGYLGQIIGFQTKNDVDDPNEVDSSLWNMMSASNAAYYEIYEVAAWVIAKEKGTGPAAAVLDTAGHFPMHGSCVVGAVAVDYQKNLHEWGQQLHARRENLANLNSTFPNMANPFPDFHSHVFSDPLNPGDVRDFWYIDPGRCMASSSAQPYGHIRVIGQ